MSQEAPRDTHLLIQFVVIGCNRPFTTVNLVSALCVLHVCVCVCFNPAGVSLEAQLEWLP